MTLEEKAKAGVEYLSLLQNNDEQENEPYNFSEFCKNRGIEPADMIEVICLGINEIQINQISVNMTNAVKDIFSEVYLNGYTEYVNIAKNIAKNIDAVNSVDGVILPFNMILGEAFVKVGQTIMSNPEIINGK